jgi:hypothetical protein
MRCVVCKKEVPEKTRICPFCGGRFFTVGEIPPLTFPPQSSNKPGRPWNSSPYIRLGIELMVWILIWGSCMWALSVPVDLLVLGLIVLSLLIYGYLRAPDLFKTRPFHQKSDGSQPQTSRTHRLP